MKVIIFGCGPMSCEPQYVVTAPGARTWQIVQTVLHGLSVADDPEAEVIVVGLESGARQQLGIPLTFNVPLSETGEPAREPSSRTISYLPLDIEAFRQIGQGTLPDLLKEPPNAVVATGSAQPYSTAALYARLAGVPLWVDVFGDPLAELQSRAELMPEKKEENDSWYYHTWKLLMDALLQGDIFSALSTRQRFALIGHLGVAGRLNRSTRCYEFVHTLPYGVFPATAPPLPPRREHPYFVIMWCGSFNTWMDVRTLAEGVVKAWRKNRHFRLLIVGGKCPGYNEVSFEEFARTIREENASELIRFVDWTPLEALDRLYSEADVGLSIDRPTYEAVLGSRTRLIHFLLAGKPVISTTPTELARDLADQGFVLPFAMGDADHLAETILQAAERAQELPELGERAREYVLSRYDGRILGAPFAEWLANPEFAPDKRGPYHMLDPENPLTSYWQFVMEDVRNQ